MYQVKQSGLTGYTVNTTPVVVNQPMTTTQPTQNEAESGSWSSVAWTIMLTCATCSILSLVCGIPAVIFAAMVSS